MEMLWTIVTTACEVTGVIVAGLPLYALPATLTLPRGRRSGIDDLTLDKAAGQLRATAKTGMALVEAARALVAERMHYCRRNSFDPPAVAFRRGYGYCTQQAYAFVDLLARLRIEAEAVYAFRNRFPDGTVGGHTWVRVVNDGEVRDVDSVCYDVRAGAIGFVPLSRVRRHTRLFKWLTQRGEAAVNAHRYYRTGKDVDL
jgi:transglutaminase-like putative cysteine protease